MENFSIWQTKEKASIPQLTTAVRNQQLIMISLTLLHERVRHYVNENGLTVADTEFVCECLRAANQQTDPKHFMIEPTSILITERFIELMGSIGDMSESAPNNGFVAFEGGNNNPTKPGILTFLLQLPD